MRPLPQTSRGGYWRGDLRVQRYTLALGLDANEGNLANDPLIGGLRTISGFATGFLRLDRLTNAGAGFNYAHTAPKFESTTAQPADLYSANVNLTRVFPAGISRFQLTHSQSVSPVQPAHETMLSWDHDWTMSTLLMVTTTLQQALADNVGVGSKRTTAGTILRSAFGSQLFWDANLTYNRITSDDAAANTNNFNAGFGGTWTIAPHWIGQARLIWNRIDHTNPLAPLVTNDKSLQLTLRYEVSGGTPLAMVGARTGALGTGRIVGYVFYDENNDGKRGPTEKGAAGITVYLDGRYPVTTDNEGRFQFDPTPTGDHTINAVVDNVPLPWGLRDETPRRVSVPLRGENYLEIPLNRLNQ